MIHVRSIRLALLFATAVCVANAHAVDLKDPKQRTSYALGNSIGNSFKTQGITVDASAVAAGIADAIAGKPAMTDAEIRTTMDQVRGELTAKANAKSEADAKAGTDYLAAKGKESGVKTTASGLEYKVINAGTGKTPRPTDTVKVHYRGTLIDGTVFDSSIERGEPVSFPVNGVIAGWTEALLLMKEGDKWQVYIPSKLAYGQAGAGNGKIPPNSALVFDIELLSIEK